MLKWLPMYITATLDAILRSISSFIEGLSSMTGRISALTAIIMFGIISFEYYCTFIKPKKELSQNKTISKLIAAGFLPGVIMLLYFITILTFISVILYTRIYSKNRSPTRTFLLLSTISTFIVFLSITSYVTVLIPTPKLRLGVYIFFASILLTTGIIAFVEIKI